MQYTWKYSSPLGELLLACDSGGLTGLWFLGAKYFARTLDPEHLERDTPVFREAGRWLDLYFAGERPDFLPALHLAGTEFQLAVWRALEGIPYGGTTTYGAIAKELAAKQGLPRMSAQAVGGAVGRNPVSILVPCHRVLGARGALTGYAGGVDRKRRLLALEGAVLGEKRRA